MNLVYYLKQMSTVKSVGPMDSVFGNSVTSKIVDFLAVQSDSRTITEISQGTGIANHEIRYAVALLVNSNVLGADDSKLTEAEFGSKENSHYYIRTDNPGGIAVIHLYNYFSSLMGRRIVLCSSDAGTISNY